jgi:hypothetical protein
MSQPDLASRLNQAISLINAGQRAEGRALLFELSKEYPEVEQIWLWLATTTEDTDQRVENLRRVLAINPRNEKARSALTRLTGEAPPPIPETPSVAPRPGSPMRTLETALIAVLGLAVIIGLVILVSGVTTNLLTPRATASFTTSNTFSLSSTFIRTFSITPCGPTLTPIAGRTLLPSWTPEATITRQPTRPPITRSITPTPTPTQTVFRGPTWTPYPTRTEIPPTATATATSVFLLPGVPTSTPTTTPTPAPPTSAALAPTTEPASLPPKSGEIF